MVSCGKPTQIYCGEEERLRVSHIEMAREPVEGPWLHGALIHFLNNGELEVGMVVADLATGGEREAHGQEHRDGRLPPLPAPPAGMTATRYAEIREEMDCCNIILAELESRTDGLGMQMSICKRSLTQQCNMESK